MLPGRRHTAPGNVAPLAVTALAFFSAGSLVVYGLTDSRGKLAVAGLCCSVLCALIYVATTRLLPRIYSPRLLLVGIGTQLIALTLIATLGLPLSPPYHPFALDVSDAPLRVVLPLILLAVGVLPTALVWRFFDRTHFGFSGRLDDGAARSERRVCLILAALVHLAYWPATMEGAGVTGYIVRIVSTAWLVSPFLAGRDSRHDRNLALIWWGTIAVNTAIGVILGTRSRALIPAVLFAAGWISAMPKRRRAIAILIATGAAIPLVQLAGAMGVVRDQLGRDRLDGLRQDQAAEMFRQVAHLFLLTGRGSQETQVQGVSRLLAWANVVVPLLTPDLIPYRGLKTLADDSVRTFQIASVSGLTADDLYDADLFNGPARIYGFHVDSSSSVEFPVSADGWSRGGVPIVLLFSIVLTLALISVECFIASRQRLPVGLAPVLVLPVAKIALLDANGFPLLVCLRSLALHTTAAWLLVAAVSATTHPLRLAVSTRRRRLSVSTSARSIDDRQ